MVYQLEMAPEPNRRGGSPNKSPAGLDWFEKHCARNRHGKIETWMKAYFPDSVSVDSTDGPLTEVVGTSLGYCISEKTRRLIESLEPSVHQFLPVVLKYGQEEYPYFILKVGNSSDYADLDLSDVEWRGLARGGRTHRNWSKKTAPLVFPNEKVQKVHLFQNSTGPYMLFVSDELHDLLVKNDISGIDYQKQIVKIN